MPYQITLANNHIYHIFNRGVRKSNIFLSKADHCRWEKLLYWCLNYDYSYSVYLHRIKQIKKDGKSAKEIIKDLDRTHRFEKPPVRILANVELTNHYHLILKQFDDGGISKFMHKIQTSYSKYFNLIYGFKGSVFESSFKAVLVKTDEQLLQLFRYIHINPLIVGLITKDKLLEYPWSSLISYIKKTKSTFLTKEYLLNYFDENPRKLWDFTIAQFEKTEIEAIQNLTHDDDYGWYEEIKRKKKIVDV